MSSRSTYNTGLTKFLKWTERANINFAVDYPAHDLHDMIVYFAVSLRNSGIASSTITSYISHVADALVQLLIIENSNQLRCQRLRWLLQGWKRDDTLTTSKRHSVTVPLNLEIIVTINRFFVFVFTKSESVLFVFSQVKANPHR